MNESENPLQALFAEALEIEDEQERAAFLARTCGTDSALRKEVDDLLAAAAAVGRFLPDKPATTGAGVALRDFADALGPGAEIPTPPTELPGARIGRYKLLEKIGEGGCGVVYMAEQEEPVRRRVALKVIKLGMDTRSVIARFEAERQALAMMDHPNIAKVFDAGATEGDYRSADFSPQECSEEEARENDPGSSQVREFRRDKSRAPIGAGRPYFVMELVRGTKITDYCEQHALSIRERIELFIQVCQAVQHAHQKGIIHRDLKPSNILVAENDGVAVPKVIDFGIAKATEGKLTDQTLFTAFEQFLGTPAYMSPEQAAMTSVDIDTRSDIYSLGVLLYELLTGTTPFDTKTLLALGVDELRRTIIEKEPKRPSTRLTEKLLAANRKVGRVSPLRAADMSAPDGAHGVTRPTTIDPDLDWIVMKCLEKDRARRYETANGLASDLRRHLNNEPVLARPPSRLYEFQKTMRRHKVGFAATAGVIVALLAGLAFAAFGFVQARRQRDYANLRAYTSDMNVVQQVWEEGNLRRAQSLLQKYVPKPGEPDVRGFEWRYLWKLCRDESRFSFTNFPGSVRMTLSPDGSFIAAGSRRIVKLLDYANGRELNTLRLPNGTSGVTALAFSPTDTNVLATVSGRKLHLWNLADKRVTSTMILSNPAVALAFSRDGKLLAGASGDEQTLELWRVADRSLVWGSKAATPLFALAFTPDGKSLISGGGELSEPLQWDLTTNIASPFPAERQAYINAIEFSPDGQLMATASNDSTVILWDLAERKLLARLIARGADQANTAKFSPDGGRLVTGHADSTVRLWDVATQQQRTIYRGHGSEVLSLAFSPDGSSIISSARDRTVKVWDLEPRSRGEILTTNKLWVRTLVFSPDSKRLVTRAIGRITVWDVATRSILADLGTPAIARGPAAFSPDGEMLVMVSGRRIALWDAATFASRSSWTNDFDPYSFSFTPDSRTLAVSGLQGSPSSILDGITNRLAFWDVTTQRRINKLAAAAPFAIVVAFSHDGKKVAIGYFHGEVRVWDYETERLLAEFTDQRSRIWSLAFSPDDAWLVAGGFDGAVVFHDLRARRTFRSIRTSTWILGLCFTPDGQTLASAEGDGTIRLWNMATREIALVLKGHVGASAGLSFSSDGKYLATCGADGKVRLWPAATSEEIPGREQPR